MHLYVDVRNAAILKGERTRHIRSSAPKATLAEPSDVVPAATRRGEQPPPRKQATMPHPTLQAPFTKRNGSAYVDALEALQKSAPQAFAAGLAAVFEGAVSLDEADFLVQVARNFLSSLALTPQQWLLLVIAAAIDGNNAVLDTAVKNARGADLTNASTWVASWRADNRESLAQTVEDALRQISQG